MDLFNSLKDKIEDILPDEAENFLKGQGKDQLMKFIMDKVQDGKHSETKELLNDTLAKHENNELDNNGIQGIVQNLSSLVKPEYIEQVKDFAMNFLNKGK